MSTNNENKTLQTPQGIVNESIKPADPVDADKIVSAFNDEYLKYYGKYVDEEKLRSFLSDMPERINSDLPEEMVWTVRDRDQNEFIGAGAIKFDENVAELGSTIIKEDWRNQTNEEGRGLYDELFSHRLDKVSELVDKGDIDIVNTQLLADRSAATQHTADKHDFAVTGIYDKKFPIAYPEKGRVTVVDMVWADSNIENDQDQVHLPEDAVKIAETSLENINDKRSEDLDQIYRDFLTESSGHRSKRYKVDAKAVDKPESDPMNFAEVEIAVSSTGDYTWDEAIEEIAKAQERIENEEDDYWVGLSIDSNNPEAVKAIDKFEQLGFEYAGFNPGKIETDSEKRDSFEMQYRPGDNSVEKQFIHEAVNFIKESGIDHQEFDDDRTGYSCSEALKL